MTMRHLDVVEIATNHGLAYPSIYQVYAYAGGVSS